MTTPVGQISTSFDLSGVRTAQPVVSAGWSRWSEELAFLLGYDLHDAGGAHILARPAGRTSLVGLTYTVRIPYCRSPGAHIVRVGVALGQSDDGSTQTLLVTLPTGATWLDAQGLDGSFAFPNPPLGRTNSEEFTGWVDVSGVDETDLALEFAFKCTASDSKSVGIQRCSVVESPRAVLSPVATEPVLDGASTRPGRLVVDGGPSSVSGGERAFYLLDRARAEMREHFCIAGVESADVTLAAVTPHWHREANTFGVVQWLETNATDDAEWFLRPRHLYRGGVSTAYKIRVRYRTSNGTLCALKLHTEAGSVDPTSHLWVPGIADVPQTANLPGTSGVWAWADDDVVIPGDSSDQLVRVWFEAKGPGAGQLLSLATIGLLEQEP